MLFKIFAITFLSMGLVTQSYADFKSIPADTAVIKVKSQDTTGYPVRLMYTENNQSKFVTNTNKVQGVYEFRIPLKGYSKAILYITSASSIIKTGKSFIPQPAPQFLIKGGEEVSIIANFNNPLDLSLKAKDNEVLLFESFCKKERQTNLLIWDQMKIKYGNADQKDIVAKAEKEINRLSKVLKSFKKEYVLHNPDTFAALLVFESYYTELGSVQAAAELKSIARKYQDTEQWKALYAKLNAANSTSRGATIPAFVGKDLNGKTFNSEDLGGKYFLIDFWGSWCQPCRASHPELKAIYERYKPLGLEVLGIAYESGSVDDQFKQWKKAIEEDQINWIHLLNTPQNNLVKLFGITSYPTKILVDPDGKILMRTSGHSEELKKQLATIFDQKRSSTVSSDKNISRDSLLSYLNQKLNENTTQSKAILKQEADVLKSDPSENNLLLGLKIYSALGETNAVQALEKDILRKFPKGLMARDLAYDKVFGVKPEPNIDVVEKAYLNWLKMYPASNYELKNREKYNFALLTLIQRYSKANNKEKTDNYLSQLSTANLRTTALFNVGSDCLDRKEASLAIKYLDEALKLSKTARSSTDPVARRSFAAMFYSNIINAYSAALLMDGQISESIKLSADLLVENEYSGMNSSSLVLTLAKGLIRNGEKLNAFYALDKYLMKNTESAEIMELIKGLYVELNSAQADFQQYQDLLFREKQRLQFNHLKSIMIREQAPLFSLYNRKGELVNLSDYKGKVVVLDFWATWCVPCVKSFPGMQATLDKYKDNKEVEFLFINTWETKTNFEKSVNELMDQHLYTFNVLYDQQSDNKELVVKQYKVSAIPAKFLIDKNGYIRFKASSSATDKASVLSEMSAMIDMVLKE